MTKQIKDTLKVEIFGDETAYILKKSFDNPNIKTPRLVKANGEEYAESTKIMKRNNGGMHVHKDNITRIIQRNLT